MSTCDLDSINNNRPELKILTDEIDSIPILDFDLYGRTIIKIINGSEPNYAIGIYGYWCTGMTTLMKYIFDILEKQKYRS
jgi:hypothetical protein